MELSASNEKYVPVKDAVEIDAEGMFVSPGFIDIHVHGGGGFDFMDGTEEALLQVAATHARYGTACMLPTTLTSSKEELFHTLEVYKNANEKNINGARFLGLHLEGPYLSINQCGARRIRKRTFVIRILQNTKRYWHLPALSKDESVAPELEGVFEFGRYLTERGIIVSLAHTDAIYEEALKGFENGYTLATHFYSAMSGVTRRNAFRYAGVIEACYLIDEMDVEIIADGVHLPSPAVEVSIQNQRAIWKDVDHRRDERCRHAGGCECTGKYETGLKVIMEDWCGQVA